MVQIECIECNEPFETSPCYIERGKRFCSNSCKFKNKQYRKSIGQSRFGKDSPGWKGGRTKNVRGYILVHRPTHPNANCEGYVMEHKLIVEKYLGFFLNKEHVVHHINNDISDNRIENLLLFKNQSRHQKFHQLQTKMRCEVCS